MTLMVKRMHGQPILVDISKVKGVRPHFTLYIGRATRRTEFTKNSKWANIYPVEQYGEESLVLYEKYARKRLMPFIDELTDQVMGCWCITTDSCDPPIICHGQILIKLWIEMHSSPCITKKCPFFIDGFCTYNVFGCYIDDEADEI